MLVSFPFAGNLIYASISTLGVPLAPGDGGVQVHRGQGRLPEVLQQDACQATSPGKLRSENSPNVHPRLLELQQDACQATSPGRFGTALM